MNTHDDAAEWRRWRLQARHAGTYSSTFNYPLYVPLLTPMRQAPASHRQPQSLTP